MAEYEPPAEEAVPGKDFVLKGDCVIHFKTGGSVKGDLSEFIFADCPTAVVEALQSKEFMKEIEKSQGDFSIVNVEQVLFVSVGSVKVRLPEG